MKLLQRAMTALLLILCFSEAGAEENRKVRLAYSAFSVAFLNLFLADNAGIFKKHGIDVELIQMAGPLLVAALVAYAYRQIPAPVQVAAVTDYTLLDQVLKESPRRSQ